MSLYLQVGFVVRLDGQRLPADLEDELPDYEFAFENEGDEGFGAFYRCERTKALDTRFGDLLHKIQDLEVGPRTQECSVLNI